jgi:hypothetical protein
MNDDNSNSLDIFGIKAYGETANTLAKGVVTNTTLVTESAIKSAVAFLNLICRPAAGEFGLLLKDKVKMWRANNAVAIVQKAEKTLGEASSKRQVHPKLAFAVIEKGSWEDNDTVQTMWAGLLASSCTNDGRDNSNLIFINLLENMTSGEAALLSYLIENAHKNFTVNGVLYRGRRIDPIEYRTITGKDDPNAVGFELDHLASLGIITKDAVLATDKLVAFVTPTPLGMHLYVRCQGFTGSPEEYFRQNPLDTEK